MLRPDRKNGRIFLFLLILSASVYAQRTGDFDNDSTGDLTVWRPTDGVWYNLPSTAPAAARTQQWGGTLGGIQDIPVPADYDGDGISDVAVWRPSSGVWFVRLSTIVGLVIMQQWGTQGDVPLPGDFDGDGKADFAVWRPAGGTWFVIRSSNRSVLTQQWGTQGDVPVIADFDGDLKTDIAVWRPAGGNWFVIKSSTGTVKVFQWGAVLGGVQDVPVPADYDGDGLADIAVWRPVDGVWYIVRSKGGTLFQQWGAVLGGVQDVPVPGDYDGDGKADIAVWRPASGTWFIRPSTNPQTFYSRQWGGIVGGVTDKPVAAFVAPPRRFIRLTGSWSLGAKSTTNDVSFPIGSLRNNGTAVDGVFHMDSSSCYDIVTNVPVHGTLIGTNLVLTSESVNSQVISFNGTVTSDGAFVHGSYAISGGFCGGESGTIDGYRVPPVTGNWAGSFTSDFGFGTVGASATLLQSTPSPSNGIAQLLGTVTFAPGSCMASGTLTNSVIVGDEIFADIVNGADRISIFGFADDVQGLSYSIFYDGSGGLCTDTGKGKIMRQ